MKTNSHRMTRTQLKRVCTSPDLGCMLGDYVLNLLNDTAAEDVEDHFLNCIYCREKYLEALSVVDVKLDDEGPDDPQPKQTLRAVADKSKVINLADYKQSRA